MFVATSVPDTIKLCRGKISGADYAENMVSNAAGIGGGWAGASAGAALGTAICPGIGTVIGGLIGGIGGGVGASSASRKVTSIFRRKGGWTHLNVAGNRYWFSAAYYCYIRQVIANSQILKTNMC